MLDDYWLKQEDEPLYEDILWSRPESKTSAGKMVIIGGNAHGFSAPGQAYNVSMEAGAGTNQVLLPDAVKKIVKGMLPDADFAPSNPSGSFSKSALDSFLQAAKWADLVLLAGDVGRNSETAILLENFVQKYNGLLTLTQDSVDYFKETPKLIVDRAGTLIVLSLAQLQKIFINTPSITPITYSMTTQQLVAALHDYTQPHQACIVTMHNNLLFIAHSGKVVTQKHEDKTWRVNTATKASVFWMQNPNKIFKSVVSSNYENDS